jgi:hypothetical protein
MDVLPSAASVGVCAILNLGTVVCYLIKIDLAFVYSEPIRIKLNLCDKFQCKLSISNFIEIR